MMNGCIWLERWSLKRKEAEVHSLKLKLNGGD